MIATRLFRTLSFSTFIITLSKNSSICGFSANSAFSLGSYARLLSTALNASFRAFSASISKRLSSTLLNLSSFMMFARRLNVEKFSLKFGSLEILASASIILVSSKMSFSPLFMHAFTIEAFASKKV